MYFSHTLLVDPHFIAATIKIIQFVGDEIRANTFVRKMHSSFATSDQLKKRLVGGRSSGPHVCTPRLRNSDIASL